MENAFSTGYDIVLQLFVWICSFPALTLSCITTNFCSVCSYMWW